MLLLLLLLELLRRLLMEGLERRGCLLLHVGGHGGRGVLRCTAKS